LCAVRQGRCSDRAREQLAFAEDGDREDDEADAGEEQRDPHDDAEVRQYLGHVAGVERGRQRRLGDPDVARAVRDRLPVLVLRRGRRVVGPGLVLGIGGRLVLAHLRIGEPAGRREQRGSWAYFRVREAPLAALRALLA
jgi:hypothetical protein